VGRPPVQNVNIELTSTFTVSMASPDTHRLEYTGQLYFLNGTWYIKYVEQEEDGQTNTTIKANAQEIVVIRNGLVSMRQSYQPGVTTMGSFHGAGGLMWMDTETKEIQLQHDAEGYLSSIKWTYILHVNEQRVGHYTVHCRLTRT
jgi:uncharacterized beta-barrel protein YwiB (DUF1934 family)